MPDYDRELQQAVQGMLDQGQDLKGYGLKASVIEGEVQVSGVVDNLAEKTRLEENLKGKQEAIKAAQKARGVTEVVSQLQIGPGAVDDSPEAIFHRQVNNDHEDAEETRLL